MKRSKSVRRKRSSNRLRRSTGKRSRVQSQRLNRRTRSQGKRFRYRSLERTAPKNAVLESESDPKVKAEDQVTDDQLGTPPKVLTEAETLSSTTKVLITKEFVERMRNSITRVIDAMDEVTDGSFESVTTRVKTLASRAMAVVEAGLEAGVELVEFDEAISHLNTAEMVVEDYEMSYAEVAKQFSIARKILLGEVTSLREIREGGGRGRRR
jgi:hypothetical protein